MERFVSPVGAIFPQTYCYCIYLICPCFSVCPHHTHLLSSHKGDDRGTNGGTTRGAGVSEKVNFTGVGVVVLIVLTLSFLSHTSILLFRKFRLTSLFLPPGAGLSRSGCWCSVRLGMLVFDGLPTSSLPPQSVSTSHVYGLANCRVISSGVVRWPFCFVCPDRTGATRSVGSRTLLLTTVVG